MFKVGGVSVGLAGSHDVSLLSCSRADLLPSFFAGLGRWMKRSDNAPPTPPIGTSR